MIWKYINKQLHNTTNQGPERTDRYNIQSRDIYFYLTWIRFKFQPINNTHMHPHLDLPHIHPLSKLPSNHLPRNRFQSPPLQIRVQLLGVKIPQKTRLLRRIIPTNPPRHEILIPDQLAVNSHLIRVLVDNCLDLGGRDLINIKYQHILNLIHQQSNSKPRRRKSSDLQPASQSPPH